MLVVELRAYYQDAGEDIEESCELKNKEYIIEIKVLDETGRFRKRIVLDGHFKKDTPGAKLLMKLMIIAERQATFVQKDRICYVDEAATLKHLKNMMKG